jgi:hypothetical protein
MNFQGTSYCNFVESASYETIKNERMSLFKIIDGELFYSMKDWPKSTKQVFWKKPLSDKETFIVTLFLHGNGCPPEILMKWVLSSQFWASDKGNTLKKRNIQLQWILKNILLKQHVWYFFDMHHRRNLYFDGEEKIIEFNTRR